MYVGKVLKSCLLITGPIENPRPHNWSNFVIFYGYMEKRLLSFAAQNGVIHKYVAPYHITVTVWPIYFSLYISN